MAGRPPSCRDPLRSRSFEGIRMKITQVDAYPLEYTLNVPRGDARGLSTRRQTTIVKISTDEGVHGWGQGGSAEVVREVFAPLLIGQDPRNTLPLWQQLFRGSRTARGAVGAIDLALWDIKGK